MTRHEDKRHPKHIPSFIGILVPAFLVIWAAVLLFSSPHLIKMVRSEALSPGWLIIGPSVFLVLFFLFVLLQFSLQPLHRKNLADFLPVLFGLIFIAILFQAAFREYHARIISIPIDISFLHELSRNKDARIRALAILASPRNNLSNQSLSSLIHRGLLDKDPLVQHAARMVIEDNLGIRLKNGDEGLYQAQELIREGLPHALLLEKGVP